MWINQSKFWVSLNVIKVRETIKSYASFQESGCPIDWVN